MSTFSGTIKMALATKADEDVGYELANLLEAIDRGDYVAAVAAGKADEDWFDEDDIEHHKALHARLKTLADKSGALWRILGGWSCVTNPANELLDLTKDTVEFHPRNIAAREALAAQEAMAGIEVASYSLGVPDRSLSEVFVERCAQRDGSYLWRVTKRGDCLNKSGEWEYEPLPSARDDAFLERCRFDSAETAITAARAAIAEAPGEKA